MVDKVVAFFVSRASHRASKGQDANVSAVMAFLQDRRREKLPCLDRLIRKLFETVSFLMDVFPEGRLCHQVPGSEVSLEDCL